MSVNETPQRRHRGRAEGALTRAVVALILLALGAWAWAEEEERFDGERCAEANAELLQRAPIQDVVVEADAGGPLGSDAGPVEDEASPDAAVDDAGSLETARPVEWARSKGRQCHRYLGRRVCEGPRKVPVPHGPAAKRAQRLGLGTPRAASLLQRRAPLPEWLAEVDGVDDNTLRWPVDEGRFWRGFGKVRHRRRWRIHRGVDIGAAPGALIRSVNDGLVGYSNNGVSGYGNLMMIIHADASVAFYAHCQANYVFAGQLVRRGQVIGEVGDTGLAYGAHLHFELRIDGEAVDPMPLFVDIPPQALKRRRRR